MALSLGRKPSKGGNVLGVACVRPAGGSGANQRLFPVFLSGQLGFGAFLGIIGLNLVENRRQMVRMYMISFECGVIRVCPDQSTLRL